MQEKFTTKIKNKSIQSQCIISVWAFKAMGSFVQKDP